MFQTATCSLGYLPFLPKVEKFCSSNEIWHRKDALAPTKHNVLCQGNILNKEIDTRHTETKRQREASRNKEIGRNRDTDALAPTKHNVLCQGKLLSIERQTDRHSEIQKEIKTAT
jgi:hypothetical protein